MLYDQRHCAKAHEVARGLSIIVGYNTEKWLAFTYLNGEGTERDIDKARHCFERIQHVDTSGETDDYKCT